MCNPLFLCSAALVLFAVNRLSNEDRLFQSDVQNLLFNFFSLQIYEVVLVLTALFLARRRIWYDASVLLVLEHSLLLVPFVLLSHASLESLTLAWMLIAAGGALAAGRYAGVRRWHPTFNLSGRSALLGAFILLANIALPLLARPILDRDVFDWETPNQILWLGALPVLMCGANLLLRPESWRQGGPVPGRPWLPLMIYVVWTAGSAVHLWSIAHICGFPLQWHQVAPVLLAGIWTVNWRLTDCVACPGVGHRVVGMLLALPVPFLAYGRPEVFIPLAGLNVVAYTLVGWSHQARPAIRAVARQVTLVSLAVLISGLPAGWFVFLPNQRSLEGSHVMAAACAFYLLTQAVLSRRMGMAFVGGGTLGVVCLQWSSPLAGHLCWQVSLAFILLHSARWEGDELGKTLARVGVALLWMAESFRAADSFGPLDPVAFSVALVLFIPWMWIAWRSRNRLAWIAVVASAVVMLAAPGKWTYLQARQHSSPGLNALVGSFLLLGMGTAVASWRHRSARPTAGPAGAGTELDSAADAPQLEDRGNA
jgi:hypothetical protein